MEHAPENMSPADAFAKAFRLHQAGDLDKAQGLYRRVLESTPDHAPSLHLLGVTCLQQGRTDEALDLIRQSLRYEPDSPEANSNLGCALLKSGHVDQAVAAFRRAVELKPSYADAHKNLEVAMRRQARTSPVVLPAKGSGPQTPELLNHEGCEHQAAGRLEQAVAAYGRALELRPSYATALYNLSNALRDLGRLDESLDAGMKAVAAKSDYAIAHNSVGSTLYFLSRPDEALQAYERALAIDPDSAETHFNQGLAHLLKGEYDPGWALYEWGHRSPYARLPKRNFAQPRWSGDDLAGRRILLHWEQGLGDMIQFARFARMVARRGGRVILECQTPLTRLLKTLNGVEQLGPAGTPLPKFDVYCPLLSVPHVMRLGADDLATGGPYLKAYADDVPAWRQRLAGAKGLKVGMVWASSLATPTTRIRGVPARQFAPILAVPGVTFFSLQIGDAAGQLSQLPPGQVTDLAPYIKDFADTAAAVSCLDLVITVDTAMAHLAGAVGRPVWTLLFRTDWRWLMDRADSPWYPTMRLFRAAGPYNPPAVIAQVADALREFAGASG